MKTCIWITAQFAAQHKWPEAPDDVAFLRGFHRHLFRVRVQVPVTHANRDVEFFDLKQRVDKYISDKYANRSFINSCENIAQDLLVKFNADLVEVSEDGENGATVIGPAPESLKVRTKCFVGIEAEGPNHGKRMLFVPGSIGWKEINEVWDKITGKVWGIYYGAGNDRTYRPDTFGAILRKWPVNRITLEVDVLDETTEWFCRPETGITVVSLNPDDAIKGCWIKTVVENTIHWKKGEQDIETMVTDPLFLQDEEI